MNENEGRKERRELIERKNSSSSCQKEAMMRVSYVQDNQASREKHESEENENVPRKDLQTRQLVNQADSWLAARSSEHPTTQKKKKKIHSSPSNPSSHSLPKCRMFSSDMELPLSTTNTQHRTHRLTHLNKSQQSIECRIRIQRPPLRRRLPRRRTSNRRFAHPHVRRCRSSSGVRAGVSIRCGRRY